MKAKRTLESKVAYRVKRSKGSVFVPSDFADLSEDRQIRRVLKVLVDKSLLVRIGYGLYARTKTSSVTGKTILEKPITALALDALQKLGVETAPSRAFEEYQSGRSTQVPTGRQIRVKGRISRKIGYDGYYINYDAA